MKSSAAQDQLHRLDCNRRFHNAVGDPLQSSAGGKRCDTPWTGRNRQAVEAGVRPHSERSLESPQGAERDAPCENLADAPLLSIAVAAQPAKARKQVQNAGHGVAGVRARRRRRSVGTPARRAVHAPLA